MEGGSADSCLRLDFPRWSSVGSRVQTRSSSGRGKSAAIAVATLDSRKSSSTTWGYGSAFWYWAASSGSLSFRAATVGRRLQPAGREAPSMAAGDDFCKASIPHPTIIHVWQSKEEPPRPLNSIEKTFWLQVEILSNRQAKRRRTQRTCVPRSGCTATELLYNGQPNDSE